MTWLGKKRLWDFLKNWLEKEYVIREISIQTWLKKVYVIIDSKIEPDYRKILLIDI